MLISIVILLAVATLMARKQTLHWSGLALIMGTLMLARTFANTCKLGVLSGHPIVFTQRLVCLTPPVEATGADAKIPTCLRDVTGLVSVLKNTKLARDLALIPCS